MLLFRKFLFYSFVLIYIIGCPIIIFDSLGIVISPTQKKLIQSTGLISLVTIPEGASVFINNNLHNQKTPAIIRDLSEGKYTIRITLDQYAPWERAVSVVKEQATTLEDIILIPKKWPKDIMSPIKIDRIFCIYNNPYIVLCKSMLLQDIYVFKIEDPIISSLKDGIQYPKKEILKPLLSEDRKYNSFRVSSVILMPKSPCVLIQAKQNDKKHYLWADLRAQGGSIIDISHLFGGSVDEIFWHDEDNENLFYISEKNINRISIKENAVYSNIASNIKSFMLFNKRLLVVTDAGQFDEIDYVRNIRESLMGQWSQMPDVFNALSTLKMRILSEKLILFIDGGGRLLSTRFPYELIPSKVTGIGDILDGNKALVWTNTQLGYVDFTEMKHEGIFEASPRIIWVIKNARDIQQAFWVNSGSHILFRDLDQIKLAEINLYAGSSIFDVGYSKGSIAYSDRLGKAFFIERDTKKFISLTVIPEHGLIQFVLPDTINKKEE